MSTISRESAFLLAKENYEFLQQHSKDQLGLDNSGKFCLKENSPNIVGLANKVQATLVKAEIWGHLIPEIKNLQAKTQFSLADMQQIQTLYDEIEQFRKANPSFLDRLAHLLENLEISLEEIAEKAHVELLFSSPLQLSPFSFQENALLFLKACGGSVSQIPAFFYIAAGSVPLSYVLTKLYKNYGEAIDVQAAIASMKTLDPNTKILLEGAEILALLGMMMFAARKSVQSKSNTWGVVMATSIIALFALSPINDQISRIIHKF